MNTPQSVNVQSDVTMKQIGQTTTTAGLWQRLKAAYKTGTTVDFEGHAWLVTGFRLASPDKLNSEIATVRRA